MRIEIQTTYTMKGSDGDKVVRLGEYATLVFYDGSYHAGEIEAITEDSVTISRADGNYSYNASKIQNIR